MPGESAATVRAEHYQARVALIGDLDDALPGRRRLSRHALRPEASSLGQRRPLRGRTLGGLPNFSGLVRVEMQLVGRHEADIGRLPHAQRERLTTAHELASGLLDRELRQLGPVVGEQNRPGGRCARSGGALAGGHVSRSPRRPASPGGLRAAGANRRGARRSRPVRRAARPVRRAPPPACARRRHRAT